MVQMAKVVEKGTMKISVRGSDSGHSMLSAVIILFLVLLIIFAIMAKTSSELNLLREEKASLEKMIEEEKNK